jgi:hypothetical protein
MGFVTSFSFLKNRKFWLQVIIMRKRKPFEGDINDIGNIISLV